MRAAAVPALVLCAMIGTTSAQPQREPALAVEEAKSILKRMSDYVAAQNNIFVTYDSAIEAVTHELEKIQFTSSGEIVLNRPDKLRARRIGGYSDVELVFDGTTLSILGKNLNTYAQVEAPGTYDQLVDRLRSETGAALPGADLLLERGYDEMTKDVIDAKHIGRGVIGGIECEHLAFRTPQVDWQLWVEIGDRPIPRKYVITSKTIAGAPQYSMQIKDWRTDAQVGSEAFSFTPPQNATKVVSENLKQADEIPPGVLAGGKQ
jgi:hypothetical protein